MKKLTTSSLFDNLSHKFPPIPFYLSDLEDIVKIAQARELQVQITDEKYEYESLDDLKNNRGNRIKRLTLTFAPSNSLLRSITMGIDNDGVILKSSKDDIFVPVWHEIRDLIQKQTPWYAKFMRPFVWGYGTLVLLLATSRDALIRDGLEWIANVSTVAGYFTLMMSLLSLLYLNGRKGVYLQREHEVQGFWSRYGEKIVLLALGTAFGVIGKVISDRLSGQ